MSRALDLRETQIRTLIRAAQKEGVPVEVRLGGATIILNPTAKREDEVDEKAKGYL